MRKRIIFSIILCMLITLSGGGVISYLSVKNSIDRSLRNRLVLAKIVSKYIDHILESNLTRLYDISISGRIDFEDDAWGPEKKAVRTAYEYSIFTDRIFLMDISGNIVLTYPHQEGSRVNILSNPYVSTALSEARQIISDVYTFERTKRKVIFTLVPLKNKNGEFIGVAGGEINPTNYTFTQIIKSIPIGKNTFIDLVDGFGTIIASNDPKRILTPSDHNRFLSNLIMNKKSLVGTCHRCHSEDKTDTEKTKDMIAFSPLVIAPWGISIREPQEIVFAPSRYLKKGFVIIGVIFLTTAFMLAIGMNRSIVRPIQLLINATRKIGEGNLSDSIHINSNDEIGTLSRSFENMRARLAESLDRIQRHSMELENRVLERTREVGKNQEKIRNLFKKVITSAEDERKRMARELHDDTLQYISVFLMNLDMCRLYPDRISTKKIEEMRDIVLKTRNSVHNIIRNLRPPALDDLGIESAVRGLLDGYLCEKGLNYFLKVEGINDASFPPQFEITVFRIIQEAVSNVARHADAENVFVVLKTQSPSFHFYIEDDGEGFDAHSMLGHTSGDGRGLGLIGMKERAALLNGELKVCSSPGRGTIISFRSHIKPEEFRNGEDTGINR